MSINAVNNSNIYQASWPKSLEPTLCKKICQFVWNLLSVIIFPIGLMRLANHYIIRPLAIKYAILPATRCFKHCEIENNKIEFKTANGEVIEGTFYKGAKHPEKLVIVSGGNMMHCEQAEDFSALMNSGVSVLSINPMGVGQSDGQIGTKGLNIDESLGLAVYSAYEFAREELKFGEKDITLYGLSLGGFSSTFGAVYVQEQYGADAVHLINDRSLSSTTDMAIAIGKKVKTCFKENPFSNFTLLGKVIKCLSHIIPDCILSLIIHIGTFLFGLRANADEAFLKLETKNKCVIYTQDDEVIPFEGASLYRAVENKTSDFSSIELRAGLHGHGSPFHPLEAKKFTDKLNSYLGIAASVNHVYETAQVA